MYSNIVNSSIAGLRLRVPLEEMNVANVGAQGGRTQHAFEGGPIQSRAVARKARERWSSTLFRSETTKPYMPGHDATGSKRGEKELKRIKEENPCSAGDRDKAFKGEMQRTAHHCTEGFPRDASHFLRDMQPQDRMQATVYRLQLGASVDADKPVLSSMDYGGCFPPHSLALDLRLRMCTFFPSSSITFQVGMAALAVHRWIRPKALAAVSCRGTCIPHCLGLGDRLSSSFIRSFLGRIHQKKKTYQTLTCMQIFWDQVEMASRR
ncbi:hypothetical protein PCH_Pc22g06870 [Penicillium rubens Wisconsin 54-1255]|uniref:Uncharacterized protein n=1 Tax=Penicillium rubens (strain ATCC 28089 / DSM 1075 / NRRL 1951 / Wisconsin 54-1255) TaxID=500485 RepID=B6HQ73_PENRW|nr:hypothetical protein PCH_Pc22g06870 [Penicillium rubens Wisconsin 54-1255]